LGKLGRMTEFLQVRDLTVRHPKLKAVALHRVSFDLNQGEALGILGESGAGKTTLARMLLCLRPADADVDGSIRFRGIELLQASERTLSKIRGANISLVAQEPELGLNPFLQVGAQILEVLRAHTTLKKRERHEEARSILSAVGLRDPDIYFAYPHQLSGGQRQRAVIAQALVGKPALLIADEPTSALDSVMQGEILGLIGDLRRREKLALIFITHDCSLFTGLVDRVLVMRAGSIVETGGFREIFTAPQNPYTERLLQLPRFPPFPL
jgi:ABC-type glutathione transport system ATPase component